MKDKKLVSIILVCVSIVLLALVIVLTSNVNYFELSNKSTNNQSNAGKIEDKVDSVVEEGSNKNQNQDAIEQVEDKVVEKVETDSKEHENQKIEKNNNVNTETVIEDKNTNNVDIDSSSTDFREVEESKTGEVTFSQNDVVSYFRASEENVATNQNDKKAREKIKESFITIVDFIFYDKEIKGYTFNELTTKTKLEVIEIALTIDNKIDKHFPDYKDTIKEKYTSIKGKLASKYLEFTASLCDSVGTDVCDQAKEDFDNMKESFGFTWELIKELASNGSSKVKEFYESWRDSK